jgi:cytochrome P450
MYPLQSDGDSWSRQRRLVAPHLNERISEVVWHESTKQAQDMLEYMLKQSNGESSEIVGGLRSIASNVISEAAYGQPQPWSLNSSASSNSDGKMTYFEAIFSIINCLVVAALVSNRLLQLPGVPTSLKKVGIAVAEYPSLAREMLAQELILIEKGEQERTNIMAMLVRLSDLGKDGIREGAPTSTSQYLSESEIHGNLFVFTAAGFDTTAGSMAYAITLLAAYPEWKQWIIEEVDGVFGGREETTLDYTAAFPRLPRCLALMVGHYYFQFIYAQLTFLSSKRSVFTLQWSNYLVARSFLKSSERATKRSVCPATP